MGYIITETELEARRQKARNRRYKKSAVKTLNKTEIYDMLNDISSDAYNISWLTDNEAADLLEEVCGGEEEASEFKWMFTDLSADADRMLEQLQDEMIWDNFDDIMVACCPDTRGNLMGYDSYEGDYFGLPNWYERDAAQDEAKIRLQRLTKGELIDTMHLCFSVAFQFLGIKARYDDLNATLEIIKGKNIGVIETIKHIEELYEAADEEGMRSYGTAVVRFDDYLSGISPFDKLWIE